MPKVRFSTDIQSISGKLCSKEGVVYSVYKQTGETYCSDRHSHHDANTAEQQTIRATFKKKAQHKIGNPYSYMRSLVTDDLKVLLAGNDITGGVNPGGSTTEGGGSGTTGGELDG